MGFPSDKELAKIKNKLNKAEPSFLLPKNASKVEKIKYKLCEKFVSYLLDQEMTQIQLAKKLKVDPSRVNEIVKYRIDLFTVDRLIELAEKIDLKFEIKVD